MEDWGDVPYGLYNQFGEGANQDLNQVLNLEPSNASKGLQQKLEVCLQGCLSGQHLTPVLPRNTRSIPTQSTPNTHTHLSICEMCEHSVVGIPQG